MSNWVDFGGYRQKLCRNYSKKLAGMKVFMQPQGSTLQHILTYPPLKYVYKMSLKVHFTLVNLLNGLEMTNLLMVLCKKNIVH